jgi:cytochrome P450
VTVQTLAMVTRQRPYLERARRRYGPIFTVRLLGLGNAVMLADPELIKQTFRADPKTLHAGTQSPLRSVLGPNSLLGIDEEQHMEQRKLLLPPFKGQRMREYEPLIAEIATAEIDTWPEQTAFEAAPAMQRIDAILDELIAVAKADRDLEHRPDVLALMAQARHEDWRPMSNPEIRDELVTMIAAGHETTAHTLSWAVERVRRHPDVLRRLVEEVHPDRFDPDRFHEMVPDTYSWIPFGGGIRRCIGATFAHMEMDVVLRTLLERVVLQPTAEPDEGWRFRGVAWTPALGGRAVVRRRAVDETSGYAAARATPEAAGGGFVNATPSSSTLPRRSSITSRT